MFEDKKKGFIKRGSLSQNHEEKEKKEYRYITGKEYRIQKNTSRHAAQQDDDDDEFFSHTMPRFSFPKPLTPSPISSPEKESIHSFSSIYFSSNVP